MGIHCCAFFCCIVFCKCKEWKKYDPNKKEEDDNKITVKINNNLPIKNDYNKLQNQDLYNDSKNPDVRTLLN
jgi:hypothetical protein